MNTKNKLNISVIGWWSWTFNVLYWLKNANTDFDLNLAAIIAMTDSGWTTWEIRDKYWVLPPWDIRRGIAALAEDTKFVRQLFEYKFEWEKGIIGWNKLGNILLTALNDIKWGFDEWLEEAHKMFRVKWKVIPVTLDDVHLWVRFEDGTEVIWEKNIDVSETNPEEKSHNTDQNIVDAFLVWWEWKINPKACDTLVSSDIIILGPGDFYTSIVPNLLSPGMKEALTKTHAKIVYVCNIMADKWETTTYELTDFIDNIEKYIWENIIDYVLVNSWDISQDLVDKYKLEWKKPVKCKDHMCFSWKNYKVVERDFLDESDYVRHNPKKIAKSIIDIVEGWIK
jgi:uncharacterized cofD-like protein